MCNAPPAIIEAVYTMLEPYASDLTVERIKSVLCEEEQSRHSDNLLTKLEACSALRISPASLDRMCLSGELERVKIRTRVFIRESSVRDIIKGKCSDSEASINTSRRSV
jgi:hypothetical protein